MNKQELIEKLESNKDECLEEARKYSVLDWDRRIEDAEALVYTQVINWVERLDEQPKVTVPKFAADWIEKCKEKATLADCLDGYYEISNGEVVSSEDFQNWVVDNENDELTAKAWMFGYEVEKEPLYQIQFPGTSWGAYLTKADNGDLVIFQNTTSGSTFTESEIKSIDERYWAFAVPVEEVK
nr:MAG TPA: Protein of unknown function (DUF1642) [Caudoviricetes sp.]